MTTPYGVMQVRRSLIHFGLGKSFSMLIAMGLLLILVRIFSIEEYGVYIVLLASLEIIQLGSNFGAYAAIQRYVPEFVVKNQGAVLYQFLIRVCVFRFVTLCIVVCVIWGNIAKLSALLGLESYEKVLTIYLLVIVVEGYARFIDAVFDSLLLQKYAQISMAIRGGGRLLGVCLIYFAFNNVAILLNFVWIELVSSGVAVTYSLVQLYKKILIIKKNNISNVDPKSFKRILSFIVPSYLAQLFGLMYGVDTMKLVVQKIFGVVEAAAFGFFSVLANMILRYLPVFLLIGMVRPLFVSIKDDDPDHPKKVNQLANLVFKLNLFVLLPLLSFMIFYREEVIVILSGGKFIEYTGYMIIFSVWMLLQVWHAVLGLIALAHEDSKSILRGTLLAPVAMILSVVVLKSYSAYGVSVGLVFSEFLWCAIVAKSLTKSGAIITLDWYQMGLMMMMAAFAGYITTMIPVNATNIILLIILFGLIGFVFLLLAYFFKPFAQEERATINKLLPRPIFIW